MIVYNCHAIKACKNEQTKSCDYQAFQKHPETGCGPELPCQWAVNTLYMKIVPQALVEK